MIQNLTSWFQQHPEISVIGFFIGLILAIWSLVVGIKGRAKKSLSLSLIGYNLIKDFSEKIDGLNVSFNDDKVKNFTVTKIAVWNSGNITLTKSDIVDADPFRIEISDDLIILDYQILQTNEPSNQFKLISAKTEEGKEYLKVDFDYIDRRQGCVIQIFHNGQSSSQIGVKGRIKGIKKITQEDSSKFILKLSDSLAMTANKRVNRVALAVLMLLSVIVIFVLFWYNPNELMTSKKESYKYLPAALSCLPYLYLSYKLLVKKVPNNLDSFEDAL